MKKKKKKKVKTSVSTIYEIEDAILIHKNIKGY